MNQEPIANSAFRPNELGSSWVGLEFLPQLAHVDAEVMELVDVGGTPNGL